MRIPNEYLVNKADSVTVLDKVIELCVGELNKDYKIVGVFCNGSLEDGEGNVVKMVSKVDWCPVNQFRNSKRMLEDFAVVRKEVFLSVGEAPVEDKELALCWTYAQMATKGYWKFIPSISYSKPVSEEDYHSGLDIRRDLTKEILLKADCPIPNHHKVKRLEFESVVRSKAVEKMGRRVGLIERWSSKPTPCAGCNKARSVVNKVAKRLGV